jgi:pectate lyase
MFIHEDHGKAVTLRYKNRSQHQAKLIQQASRVHLLASFHLTKNSLPVINMRFFELATALAAAGTVSAAPMEKRAAAVDELVGFAAGTTGGGSGAGTTVSDCAGLTAAAKNGGVIKIKGTLTGCGIVKIVSNTSVLGVGSSAGLTDGGFQVRKADNVIIRNLKVCGA